GLDRLESLRALVHRAWRRRPPSRAAIRSSMTAASSAAHTCSAMAWPSTAFVAAALHHPMDWHPRFAQTMTVPLRLLRLGDHFLGGEATPSITRSLPPS